MQIFHHKIDAIFGASLRFFENMLLVGEVFSVRFSINFMCHFFDLYTNYQTMQISGQNFTIRQFHLVTLTFQSIRKK